MMTRVRRREGSVAGQRVVVLWGFMDGCPPLPRVLGWKRLALTSSQAENGGERLPRWVRFFPWKAYFPGWPVPSRFSREAAGSRWKRGCRRATPSASAWPEFQPAPDESGREARGGRSRRPVAGVGRTGTEPVGRLRGFTVPPV